LLDGSRHPFRVSVLDGMAVKIKQATGMDNVHHLKNGADSAGRYAKAAAGITVGGWAAATTMQNDKSLVIDLIAVGRGVDFRLAASGMDVTLVK